MTSTKALPAAKDQLSRATACLEVRAAGYQIEGQTILQGVTLDVPAGQVTVVVGPNGAGKSTLLGLLAGDLAPASGQVLWQGQPISAVTVGKLARLRSVMAGETHIAFPFTVLEVVRMGRAPWHGRPEAADDDAVVEQAMSATDTLPLAGRRFPTLSNGEKARSSFARTLVQRGRIVLLDEPTAALDVGHQELVMGLARQEAQAGAAVVAVVHDLALAAAWANQVALICNGRLDACGLPDQVLTTERLSRVYQHPVDVLDHPLTGARLVIPRRGEGT
ncbi:MAG: heme ABC transporter ATP-binding protein [Micrococcales bacterium]|nr:heme ABC transporter ATP-binding protein [Micrococcales bacterium]